MSTTFTKLNEGWNADPNAPEETIAADGQTIVLEFYPNAMIFPALMEMIEFVSCSTA